MGGLSARVALALGLLAVAALGAGAGAATDPTPPTPTPATARAVAIRVVLPGGRGGGTASIAAPPAVTPLNTAGFAYPEAGTIVSTVSTTASATVEKLVQATATSGVSGLSLFSGEITADSVLARAAASVDGAAAGGDFDGTTTQNLQVFGSPAPAGTEIPLGDWGTLTLNAQDAERGSSGGTVTYTGSVVALDIRLTAEHGGLPAGSEIQIGYAEAAAQAEPAIPKPESVPKPEPTPKPTTKPEPKPTAAPKVGSAPAAKPEPKAPVIVPDAGPPEGLFPVPSELLPPLDGGPYVFPVFGSASYVDTYGDVRSDVTYHHGADIFAELGRPLVAVADGTVFSVGWNKIGGNRLWLRDRQGNAFYYAHLSAFSTLIFNGAHVRAGQVVGFMGNTGDADATPPHLHFEIHPVSLLYLGYDGAVDPNPYLDDWRRLARLPFPVPPGWAPSASGSNAAPQPGAILLDVSDISSADGLDPASLQRAIDTQPARP